LTLVRRVSVVGNSGSGKSVLAAAIAGRLGGVPHLELDAVKHQPNWTERPPDQMRAIVAERAAADRWVIDGNYAAVVQDLVWARADTVVWLDLPRRVVMRQIVGRTLRRVIRREELWNGNRERWRNLLTLDPEESVIVWAWVSHDRYRARYEAAMREEAWAHLRFVRLRSRQEVRAFLGSINP
jgi:adenylate kinase family enzyme